LDTSIDVNLVFHDRARGNQFRLAVVPSAKAKFEVKSMATGKQRICASPA
jgi:hypothetical protein